MKPLSLTSLWTCLWTSSLTACTQTTQLPSTSATLTDTTGAAPYTPGPSCEWTWSALAGSDDSGLGVTIDEHLAAIGDTVETTLKWDATGETTALTTALSISEAAWVTGVLVDPVTGEEVTGTTGSAVDDCPPFLGLAGELSLITDDGHLAEHLAVEASSSVAGTARVDAVVAYDDLMGGDLPLGINPDLWRSINIDVAVNISSGASGGELAVDAWDPVSTGGSETTTDGYTDTADDRYSDDVARWPWTD